MKEPKFETSATGGYVNPSKNSVKVVVWRIENFIDIVSIQFTVMVVNNYCINNPSFSYYVTSSTRMETQALRSISNPKVNILISTGLTASRKRHICFYRCRYCTSANTMVEIADFFFIENTNKIFQCIKL